MEILSMLDMKFLDPVLELFKNPVREISLRLDKNQTELLNGMQYTINNREQLHQAYCKINDIMKQVQFKLCIIYSEWVKGTIQLTNEEILQLSIGLTYEIEEARYHLLRVGNVVLPALHNIKESSLTDYKKLIEQFLYGAHLISPDRFVKDVDLKQPHNYSEEAIRQFRSGISMPTIEWNDAFDYYIGTMWTKEDIDGCLDRGTIADSIHSSIPPLIKFCEDIEWIFDFLPPNSFEEAIPTDIQKAILCLYKTLRQWGSINLNRLLKDEQIMTLAYNHLKMGKKQLTQYSIWRDVELTQHLTPTVIVSTTLN